MTAVPGTALEVESWLAAFARRRRQAMPEPAWVSTLRDAGISAFTESGFPTPVDEEWRKTNVNAIARTAFSLDAPGGAPAVQASDLTGPGSAPSDAHRLVLVDGVHDPALSRTSSLPHGVVLCPLDEAIARHPSLVEPHLARQAGIANQPFAALNTAFMATGFFLYLPEGAQLTEPLHLIFVARTGAGGPVAYHPRHLILAGAGSRARVVESYLSPPRSTPTHAGASFTNVVTEILLEESAALEHVKVQNEALTAFHVAATCVRQHRASRFTSHSFSIGAGLARNDLNVLLAQEQAECELNGLYMAGSQQHVDHHTVIDHVAPNCISRELYKGVLGGRARGVFNGKVIVRPDAHGTDSLQANRNLLLSEEALVDTKPELQIFNNDVKCRHAATTGQLDEIAMFYLRSRAIGVDEARSLLIHAFVSDVVRHIDEGPTRSAIEAVVGAREAAA